MKRYLLASDLDGTFIKHNDGPNNPRSILEKDIEILKQFNEEDNIFIICTGRDKASTFKLFEKHNLFLKNFYFITSSGAEIYTSDKKCIYKKVLNRELSKNVFDIFLSLNDSHLVCAMFDGEVEHEIKSLEDFNKITEPIINICVFSNRNEINDTQTFYELINRNLSKIEITRNNWYVDIIPESISKATSIQYVLKLQEDSEQIEIISIGDSWNDIPMFEIAKDSYTFNDSPVSVKEMASYTVNHFHEAIKKYIRKKL